MQGVYLSLCLSVSFALSLPLCVRVCANIFNFQYHALTSVHNCIFSLGGNCKTTMMAMVSPAVEAFQVLSSTLVAAAAVSSSKLSLAGRETYYIRTNPTQYTSKGVTVDLEVCQSSEKYQERRYACAFSFSMSYVFLKPANNLFILL